jgi:hypothetical protein
LYINNYFIFFFSFIIIKLLLFIFFYISFIKIQNSTFRFANGYHGGSIYCGGGDVQTVTSITLIDNTFISLLAVQGGAIYTSIEIVIKRCKFVNNSASDNEGNDIYAFLDSGFYDEPANLEDDCSWSISPAKFLMKDGV